MADKEKDNMVKAYIDNMPDMVLNSKKSILFKRGIEIDKEYFDASVERFELECNQQPSLCFLW